MATPEAADPSIAPALSLVSQKVIPYPGCFSDDGSVSSFRRSARISGVPLNAPPFLMNSPSFTHSVAVKYAPEGIPGSPGVLIDQRPTERPMGLSTRRVM